MREYLSQDKVTRFILFAFIAIICICVFCAYIEKIAGLKIINEVSNFIESYPTLTDPYTYSELILCDNSAKYLVLHVNNKVLAVGKYVDGLEIISVNGKTYSYTEDNVLLEIVSTADPLQDALQLLRGYAVESHASFSTKHVLSAPYPLWISGGETYIECTAGSKGGHIERIATGDNEECLRWYILSKEDMILFLHACSDGKKHNLYLPLWGELPSSVYELIEN